MMKLMTAVVGAVLASGAGFAKEPVAYLDWDGAKLVPATCSDYEVVTNGANAFAAGVTYVVTGEVSTTSRITVNGTTEDPTRLILCDGAKLTASQGIEVTISEDGATTNALIVCGQQGGTGALVAQGGSGAAGIGGGGYDAAGGAVTINGGTVMATGGAYAAGVGGGLDGTGATVMINGGTVTATGNDSAAGIGGGVCGAGGTVLINGGVVTARGGRWSAGIGGGENGAGGTVVIAGGAVKVAAGGEASVIGHGSDNDDDGSVSISGGIFAMTVEDGWCATGYGAFDNSDPETQGEYPYAVVPAAKVTIRLPVGVLASWTAGDGSKTNAVEGDSFKVQLGTPGVKLLYEADPAFIYVGGELTHDLGTVSEDRAVECQMEVVHREVEYVDGDGRLRTNNTFWVVGANTMTLTGGWYLVEGTVSRAGIDVAPGQTVCLILADDASLTVQGDDDGNAGVDVTAGETLVIYGQTKGTGVLDARGGGGYGAGIGGGMDGVGGMVTVNGGRVMAQGDKFGAGIGGGMYCAGGTVTVNGGVVTATGGKYGAGIGGGMDGAGGMVVVSNGAVKVIAGAEASVIGHGSDNDDNGSVSISGGIFAMTVEDGWLTEHSHVIDNPDPETNADYPYQVITLFRLTVPQVEHATVQVTTNGTVVAGFAGSVDVLLDSTVRVAFAAEQDYRIAANGEKEWTLTGDVTFGTTPGFPLPTVEGIPGIQANPWPIGADVVAYTNANGALTITGTGAMNDFASAADVPWNPALVTAVTVGEGVTRIGKNALADIDEEVAVNGTALSFYDMMAGARGASEPVLPEGTIPVSKTALEAAGAETLTIVGGTAYLGVSVKTNADVTAETKSWGKFNVQPGDVSVENGSVIIAVPANAEKGFMVLESGDAK